MPRLMASLAERAHESRYGQAAFRQWHPTLNGETTPSDVAFGSHLQAWWLCDLGHHWLAQIKSRTCLGRGCPFCAGQKAWPGFNDLRTIHPQYARQWHHELNGELTPDQVTCGSKAIVWWICEMGHEWDSSVNSRVSNATACPVCSNKRLLVGFNDLATTHPHVASEWSQRNDASAHDVFAGNTDRFWWACACGYEWVTSPNERTHARRPTGCPSCVGSAVVSGLNDLETTHADLAAQWHPAKNGRTKASDVSYGSTFRAWWVCNCGHEWNTTVNNRTRSECPKCARQGSSGEAELASAVASIVSGAEVQRNVRGIIGGQNEVDIYVPSLGIGIEFNGVYWHSDAKGRNRHYHADKWARARDAEVNLVFVWEDDWSHHRPRVINWLRDVLEVGEGHDNLAVAEVGELAALAFLSEFHIDGPVEAERYFGMIDPLTRGLRSVIAFDVPHPSSALRLRRFASDGLSAEWLSRALTRSGSAGCPRL